VTGFGERFRSFMAAAKVDWPAGEATFAWMERAAEFEIKAKSWAFAFAGKKTVAAARAKHSRVRILVWCTARSEYSEPVGYGQLRPSPISGADAYDARRAVKIFSPRRSA